jgi:hypothetical protein
MAQAKSVAQFVDGFFLQPLQEQAPVRRQPVEFLPQAVEGYKSAASLKLRFAEDKGQNRYVQIEFGYSEQTDLRPTCEGTHSLEDGRRMILTADGIKCEVHGQLIFANMTGNLKDASQFGREIVKNLPVRFPAIGRGVPVTHPHREQVDGFHSHTSTLRFKP